MIRRCLRYGLKVMVLILAARGSPTQAQGDCPAILGEPGHKVLLDDVRDDATAAQSPALVEAFRNKLYFQLLANVDELETDFADLAPRGSRCPGRWPTEGYLTEDVAKLLNGRDVVVEVWGQAGLEAGAGGQLAPRAVLTYALIPVKRYLDELSNLRFTYPAAVPEQPGSSPGLPDLSETARRLQMYFTLGAGVKSLKLGQYHEALKLFCRSVDLILAKGPPALSSGDTRLLERVRGLARQTVEQALADPVYLAGSDRSLQVLSPEQRVAPCGESVP